jgi:sterol desaturase/sphingolipid hydroxylase (fatty acid hydroxylase superfamily)
VSAIVSTPSFSSVSSWFGEPFAGLPDMGKPTHLLLAASALLLVAVLVEALVRHFVARRRVDWREIGCSIVDAGVRRSIDLAGITLVAPIPLLAWRHRLGDIPMTSAWTWIGLFLLVEFAYYWHHRFAHTVRFFWATHSVHHSSNAFMFASAIRLGWTGRLGGAILFFSPLIWVGFPPAAVFGIFAVGLFYQFWLHAEWMPRLGPLEWVLNTPTHHKVHHASNPEYLDCNYGNTLIVFDRLFGTFVAERKDIEIRYGLTTPVTSHNPLVIEFGQWVALGRDFFTARGLRNRMKILFGGP